MLIDILSLRPKINPIGIIHVGAHWAQEHPIYKQMGVKRVVYIEPCSDAFAVLEKRFSDDENVRLLNVACGRSICEMEINIERANQGQSNSFFPLGTHAKHYPEIKFVDKEVVSVIPLDYVETSDCDFLMIDTQGSELDVLRGAEDTLKRMQWVYAEVNKESLYEGCPMVTDIDSFLNERGFTPINTVWTKQGWGDRLYRHRA